MILTISSFLESGNIVTAFGCEGFGVYGSAATPQRKSGLVGKLLIRSSPILPVKKADWPGEERSVLSSSPVGT